jgi:hypothetical protein
MADPRNPFDYPINPAFGSGIYRRRIRLTSQQGSVLGELEDCNHGFSVRVYHDFTTVTGIEAQHHRIPFTTCGGASEPLMKLIGLPVGLSSQELSAKVETRANCTHWLDLSLLAIRHISRCESVREYNIAIPDEAGKATQAKVYCNGNLIHSWLLQDWIIQQPETLAGNTVFKGFSAWANTAFTDEEEKEAAFILQKGYFVSRARRFDLDILAGESASAHASMAGACYSYSAPQSGIAVRTDKTTRDFTHIPEELLLFK